MQTITSRMRGPLGVGAVLAVASLLLVPAGPAIAKPFDGVPSPDGSAVLFTAYIEGVEPFVYTESMQRADAAEDVRTETAANASPNVLDAVEVYQCNIRKNSTYPTKGAVSHPASVRQKTAQKLCYTTPVVIISGKKKTTFNPTVIVSENNRRIFTSIPTTTSGC